jgi:hypothetical protein
MTSNGDLSPLATLRSECLHLAVRMLSYGDADPIDPRDAIRVAEEYVVWILEAGCDDATVDPGQEGALRRARGDLSEQTETEARH